MQVLAPNVCCGTLCSDREPFLLNTVLRGLFHQRKHVASSISLKVKDTAAKTMKSILGENQDSPTIFEGKVASGGKGCKSA
jgi:hypothetical protein